MLHQAVGDVGGGMAQIAVHRGGGAGRWRMRVFATGATGLVGAHTVLALLDAGHEMRLLVRDEPRARRWFESRGQHIERFVTVDITDQAAVQHAMAGCDAV